MSREIKFRGKSILKNEWWIGFYVYSEYENKHFIVQNAIDNNEPNGSISFAHFSEVLPETIYEYTGLKDKNGIDIYEGDICKTTYYNYVEKNAVFTQIVVFENGTFAVKSIDKEISEIDDWRSFSSLHKFFMPTPNKIEVIGNIYDNPNLLQ